MAGILDSKQRVIDLIVTDEGKRQLASGKMQIEFATFTDAATFYAADIISGSDDASSRVYLEASCLPCDSVTFESNEYGRLNPFKNANEYNVFDGSLTSGSDVIKLSTGNAVEKLLKSSLDSFKMITPISTNDNFFNDNSFELNDDSVTFIVTDDRPAPEASEVAPSLESLESLFNDKRLTNSAQFLFLPPKNKNGTPLSMYRNVKSNDMNAVMQDLFKQRLPMLEKSGFSKDIKFIETSRENNIFAQFFEVSETSLTKVDVINAGTMMNPLTNTEVRVFFAGKVLIDGNGMPTYVNLFTLVLE